GHGGAQNIEKFPQGASAVGGLLLQFHDYRRVFLAEDLDQKGLRVHRTDAPRLEVLSPEVAKVESHNYRRLNLDRSRQYMTVLFIVGHPGNQRLVATDPCLGEVGAQFSLEISCERTRPPELQFQGTGCLTNDFL